MSQAYARNLIHCVFSTKNRENSIPADSQEKLWAYLLGIAKNLKVKMLATGGTANHIHLLMALPATLTLAEAVQKLKANSSRWMGEQKKDFSWQRGYGAFSVSPSMVETVREYVRHQTEHHKRRNFEEEFLALLQKSGVDFDARHVFE